MRYVLCALLILLAASSLGSGVQAAYLNTQLEVGIDFGFADGATGAILNDEESERIIVIDIGCVRAPM